MKKLIATLGLFSLAIAAFATGVVATATGTNPTCYGFCNGSATAMAGGGVGPYGFTWTGPSSYTASGANISGLCAGTYVVTATDSSDMTTAQYTLVLSQPGMLAAAITGGGPVCSGSCVSMAGYATGGSGGGYTYSWSPAAGLSSSTISNPTACPVTTTVYTLTVTDANGCTANTVNTVGVNPVPTITVNSITICAGNSGTLSASGASTYSWSGGMTTATVTVSPSSTTTYTVMGTAAGCTGTATATVTVNYPPVVTLSPSPSACGGCNGSITASVPGGTVVSWNGPSGYTSTVLSPTNLCTGFYTVNATLMGCVSTTSTTVGSASTVSTTIGSYIPSSCSICNGGATVYATGGTPPYAFLWSDAGAQTTATATGLCAGTYSVTVTDAAGCTSVSIATISSTAPITAMVSTTSTACGFCNGGANVTASGGTGPYTYTWTPSGGTGTSLTALCAGIYNVTVTDMNGCSSTASGTVTSATPVYVTASISPSTCGMCNGTVSVFQSGGVAPYLYDLNNGSPTQTNGNFSSVCSGAYIATVTDANGCSGIYTLYVASTNTSSFSVSNVIQNESASGLHDGSVDLTVTGSTGPYTFLWSNGATTEDVYSLAPGSYNVTVTDSNGDCGTYYFNVSTTSSAGYVTGYIYNDNNSNCVFDVGDAALSGYCVQVTSGPAHYYGYANSAGYYSVYVPSGGSYTVTPYNTVNLEAACTNSYSVSVTAGGTVSNINFSYTIPTVYDVCVSAYSTGIVPGFNGGYSISLQNYGNMPSNGVVYFVLPPMLNYLSASPVPSSISGDTLFWNYTGLAAYSNSYYYVQFYTPSTVPLGLTATAYAHATLTNGTDVNPACNSYTYTRLVSGSFDPNEKTVSPSGTGVTGDIPLTEDEFTYLVAFQNTGTGPAVNITITDTLSSLLDNMSFAMIDASHPYVVEFLPGNVLRWEFNNIMLPDSTTDEAASHGHVQFRIHKLNAPVAGQVIRNKAYIYFDFNAPVITNTAINTYNLAAAVEGQFNENGAVAVYPNPFTDNTTFVISSEKLNETYSFELKDVLGKTVRKIKTNEKQFSVSRTGLENGMYFYSITGSDGVVGVGKVIIK
ncbi:MAG: hypothetical protein JWO09_2040 [Bacteroidetes bacterium]|nr:hypothetical protein [Bacteroidota bacterium]